MLARHEITFRARYQETDGQGRVHHAHYFSWFETGRVEQLRAAGYSYREFEEQGLLLVVVDIRCRYYAPAAFDDLLRLETVTKRCKGVRIDHEYRVYCGDKLLAKGESTVACVDREGKVQRLPGWITGEEEEEERK
jgi:acyl-CoA thioester hydrolase